MPSYGYYSTSSQVWEVVVTLNEEQGHRTKNKIIYDHKKTNYRPAAGVSPTLRPRRSAPGCWPCRRGPCAHARCDGLSPPASWGRSARWSVGRRCRACLQRQRGVDNVSIKPMHNQCDNFIDVLIEGLLKVLAKRQPHHVTKNIIKILVMDRLID